MSHLGSIVGRQCAVGLLALAVLGFGRGAVYAGEAAAWPSRVSAHYRLYFSGFDVGNFEFQSKFGTKSYTATGSANVSALFGAFIWKGTMEAKGLLGQATPQPSGYALNFKTKSKDGSVKLGFDKAGVKDVALVPHKDPSPEAVPVQLAHLKSVLDPMAAILAMTHAAGNNPCDKKVPIFDGKARFDLVLSLKGEQKLSEKIPSGQPSQLVVCRVKYVPIAGHKPKDFANPWIDYGAIEIALRPVPSANIYVPYRVIIPTTIGSAVMSAERVDITASNKAQIALTQ